MFTAAEWDLLVSSMEYTVRSFENYTGYPSYEFKRQRIKEAADLLSKIRTYRREMGRSNICEHCGGDLPPYPGQGAPRIYCSDDCRKAAYKQRRKEALSGQPATSSD